MIGETNDELKELEHNLVDILNLLFKIDLSNKIMKLI